MCLLQTPRFTNEETEDSKGTCWWEKCADWFLQVTVAHHFVTNLLFKNFVYSKDFFLY